MALDLRITLTDYTTCTTLYAFDITGTYNAISNTGGYGTPNPATSAITEAVLTITYGSYGAQTAAFTFTVLTNTITAASLVFAGGAPVDILADLQSTVFPFTSENPFNFMRDYGVDLPTLEDQVVSLTWYIEGVGFDYTNTQSLLISCNTEQCIKNLYLTTGINSDILQKAQTADTYVKIAGYAAEEGQTSNATTLINKASQICQETAKDCGCS